MNSIEVREQLIDALKHDLVGPVDTVDGRQLGSPDELLPQAPSRWYLTGFLVPLDADESQRVDETSADELDSAEDGAASDDGTTPEAVVARVSYMPSSIGLSMLVAEAAQTLQVELRWGDYHGVKQEGDREIPSRWQRTERQATVEFDLPMQTEHPIEREAPGSGGLVVALAVRPAPGGGQDGGLPRGVRSVSVFAVNRRPPAPDVVRDQAFAFQVELRVKCEVPFVPRPNLCQDRDDWDERVADLQYRDAYEFGVGHSVAAEAVLSHLNVCREVRSCWLPDAEVERVAPAMIPGVELSMDSLAQLADGADAQAKLGGLVSQYRDWIKGQGVAAAKLPHRRQQTAKELLDRAIVAAERIEQGVALLAKPRCLEAFRVANRAMAAAGRQRQGAIVGKDPTTIQPKWRPFQLAFLLMNLPGIADPTHDDRNVVDLLFFPTGGGKTEAYLGLAAFTLVLRRLENPGIASAGLSVLMRYTLRLLTLDQLSRAATLICALELERQQDVDKLGEWPFEIGLWVGKAATPNVMGAKGDGNNDSARAKTIAFGGDDNKPSPIPLEECPWCGTKFKNTSFRLSPNPDYPTDLRISCANRNCIFTRGHWLPVLAVDEPIYRRLPCFMIATVDKFAAMPWTGEVGAFFGRVQRYDNEGFYGPCTQGRGHPLPIERLLPPELVIQDELHLISGPLGTMVGLYETAIDELSTRTIGERRIGPKIVASTATVRRAESQIQALFNRRMVDIFPPPGPNRRDSFFAIVHSATQSNARMYLGVAAQGRSPKVVMLRVFLALLAAAQKAYNVGPKGNTNPADAYMTLLGYFNSLRELGGARRIIEDEVVNRLAGYATRTRIGEQARLFAGRKIAYDVVELTSRVSTDKVAEAKQRLQLSFDEKEHVDVAIATNMISVGLDIVRLGLMVVMGQPKTSAEYIQATSRVGRDPERPGLVVTILNIHKPRDRSHYERFANYHQTFYRSVEATSVTPFSPRALDRGLAGTLVALARQGHLPMTSPKGAGAILHERPQLAFVATALAERAASHAKLNPADAARLKQRVQERAADLLDDWSKTAQELQSTNAELQYQVEVGAAQRLLYEFLHPDLKRLPPTNKKLKFRANRSLRDVEPSVNLWVRTLDNVEIDEDDA